MNRFLAFGVICLIPPPVWANESKPTDPTPSRVIYNCESIQSEVGFAPRTWAPEVLKEKSELRIEEARFKDGRRMWDVAVNISGDWQYLGPKFIKPENQWFEVTGRVGHYFLMDTKSLKFTFVNSLDYLRGDGMAKDAARMAIGVCKAVP